MFYANKLNDCLQERTSFLNWMIKYNKSSKYDRSSVVNGIKKQVSYQMLFNQLVNPNTIYKIQVAKKLLELGLEQAIHLSVEQREINSSYLCDYLEQRKYFKDGKVYYQLNQILLEKLMQLKFILDIAEIKCSMNINQRQREIEVFKQEVLSLFE